jgi:hypothetical protein
VRIRRIEILQMFLTKHDHHLFIEHGKMDLFSEERHIEEDDAWEVKYEL